MRKLVACLALSTLAFAGSTLYLWSELQRLRERGSSSEALAPAPSADMTAASIARQPDSPAAATDVPASTAQRAPPTTAKAAIDLEGDGRQMMADRARKTLPDFDDPQKRQKMVKDSKDNLHRSYRGVGRFLDLDADTEDRLMELLANQEVSNYEAYLRCSLDDGCRLSDPRRERHAAEQREIAALIGAEGQQRFEQFQMSISERSSIPALRGRFTDATRLTDDQTERLILAMAEVRQRAEGDLALRNAGISGYGGGVFGFIYSGDTSTPEIQIAEATEYGQRIHERAAQILDKAQLAIFDEARAETLRNLEQMLRQPETKSR